MLKYIADCFIEVDWKLSQNSISVLQIAFFSKRKKNISKINLPGQMDKLRARKRNKAAVAVTMPSSATNVARGKGVRWHFDKVRVAEGNTVAHLLAPK